MTVVTLSGGQDSTTCLAWALRETRAGRIYDGPVEAVSFDYGQRHRVELDLARETAEAFGVQHTILDLGPTFTQMGHASLTNPRIDNRSVAEAGSGNTWAERRGLPPSFVPGRNIILLGLAAAFALPREHLSIVTGVCEADDAGYPDCRDAFVSDMEFAIRTGMDAQGFNIFAPLMHTDKAGTFQLAEDLGILDIVLEQTNTCYEGDRSKRHAWGYGCGECPACKTRADGFRTYIERKERTPA